MAVVKELIRKESDGTLSFGNYELKEKKKLSDFEYQGDLYKVKTYYEITKLEKNGLFVYESVPGTTVLNFKTDGVNTEFKVEAAEDASITLGAESEQEYRVFVDDADIGTMKTNLGGKLSISVELNPGQTASVKVEKI